MSNYFINNDINPNITNLEDYLFGPSEILNNDNTDLINFDDFYDNDDSKKNKLTNNNLNNKNILTEYIKQKENNDFQENIDEENINNVLDIDNYNTNDLTNLFLQFDKAVIIVQIIDGKINFIEKKGYETRNQSVIDLLISANNYKKLPDIQFIIFTDDFLPNIELSQNYLFSFCKNYLYKSILFPNFNFNHWKEAKIDYYSNIYNNFTNIQNKISWKDKYDTIFWSGSNTNKIRQKIYNGANIYNKNKNKNNNNNNNYKNHNYLINLNNNNFNNNNNNKYYSIEEHSKYKYLINMNGYAYGGRLNYLFLTGSCIIILKNTNIEKQWEEFFYDYFQPGIDYIEILYDEDDKDIEIINKINNSIYEYNCEEIAINSFNKAQKIFNLNNIYNYIYNLLNIISPKCNIINNIEKNIFHTSNSNIYLKERIFAIDNSFSFYFKGTKAEIKIIDNNENNSGNNNEIILYLATDETIILYNNIFIYNKNTPYIVNSFKEQFYKITITNNNINIIIDNKLNIINESFYSEKIFNILSIEIKTENSEGFWIT